MKTLLTPITIIFLVGCDPTIIDPSQPVWSEDFENMEPHTLWKDNSYLTVSDNCGVGGGNCVLAEYHPTSNGSPRITFTQDLPPSTEYTLNYSVRFEEGFEWMRGGKLHGLGPRHPTTGCEPTTPSGWSARTMWRDEGKPSLYTYNQHRQNRCGDIKNAVVGLETGRYYSISLYVKVNQPYSESNGQVSLYIDGELVANETNLQLRSQGGRSSEINQFLFSTFFGGNDPTWAPSKRVYASFDNFSVYPGYNIR